MIRSLFFYPILALSVIFFGTTSVVGSLFGPRSRLVNWSHRTWGRLLLRAGGARLRVEGLEHLVPGQAYVYISNHQSYFDVWALLAVLPHPVRMLTKKELYRIPFLGWALSRSGHVRIDRERRDAALPSLKVGLRRIRDLGISLVSFPEGTRSRDGLLGAFKKGGFHLALQAGVPVVAVAIHGSYHIWPRGRYRIIPGLIRVRIGVPFVDLQAGMKEVRYLIEEVRSFILQEIGEREPESDL